MKRILSAFLLVLIFLPSLSAQEEEETERWSFHSEFDLFLALKAGAEYRFSDLFGLRGAAGLCLINPTQISYTIIGIGHLAKPTSAFQCDIHAGLIQAIFIPYDPEQEGLITYWIPGLCVALGFRSKGGHTFRLRAGAGVGLGYDLGEWQEPSFMPNLAVEYGFPLR